VGTSAESGQADTGRSDRSRGSGFPRRVNRCGSGLGRRAP